MALQTSGQISLSNIAAEFGGSAPHALSEYYGKGNAPASGQIRLANDFYGTSSQFAFTISSNTANANLASLATAAGWDGSSKLVCTINSGVWVYSTSTGTPALTVSGTFPAGVTLINNGYIAGKGGAGGRGGSSQLNASNGYSGLSGGLALSVSSTITINNAGTIAGGGGGGGGGGLADATNDCGGGGGGGGRTGLANSAGGAKGTASGQDGSAGGAGTSSSAGNGGSGYLNTGWYGSYIRGGNGGSGGGWGSNGSAGSKASAYNVSYTKLGSGGSGGSAGSAVSGNSNITWSATGTRYGAIA